MHFWTNSSTKLKTWSPFKISSWIDKELCLSRQIAKLQLKRSHYKKSAVSYLLPNWNFFSWTKCQAWIVLVQWNHSFHCPPLPGEDIVATQPQNVSNNTEDNYSNEEEELIIQPSKIAKTSTRDNRSGHSWGWCQLTEVKPPKNL